MMRRAPTTIRAISYNVLADQFSYHHQYCPPRALAWPHRLATILRQVVHLDPDLLFLQEIQQGVFHTQLRTTLAALGYEAMYCSTRLDDPDTDFGPVLAYKTSRLKLLVPGTCNKTGACHETGAWNNTTTMRFCDALGQWHPPAADTTKHADDAFHAALGNNQEGAVMALLTLHTPEEEEHHAGAHMLPGTQGMSVDNTASTTASTTAPQPISKHTSLAASQQYVICAVATHLHWNPQFPDVKTAQAAILCQQITQFMAAADVSHAAVVIGGDFNSLPKKTWSDTYDPHVPAGGFASGVYTLMTKGVVGADHPDHPATRRGLASCAKYPLHAHGLQLASVNAAVNHGREPLLTNCTDTFRGCLDYVFFSREHWKAVGALDMPYQVGVEDVHPEDVAFPPIPNHVFPSDHLPVGGDLVLL